MTSTIIFVRHAPTLENETHVIGHTDPPLHDPGLHRARQVADALLGIPFTRIVSSPLKRALQTATEISRFRTNCPIVLEPRLAELHLGVVDGMSSFEAYDLYRDEFDRAFDPNTKDFSFPAGERWSDALQRMDEALSELIKQAVDETVCVVSHGAMLGLWRTRLAGASLGTFRTYQPKHASFSVVHVDGGTAFRGGIAANADIEGGVGARVGKWRIVRWNETSHLR